MEPRDSQADQANTTDYSGVQLFDSAFIGEQQALSTAPKTQSFTLLDDTLAQSKAIQAQVERTDSAQAQIALLQSELQAARSLTYRLMATTSELGHMLQFIKYSFQLNSDQALAKQLLAYLKRIGLQASVLVHHQSDQSFYCEDASALEDNDDISGRNLLLDSLHKGRIIELNDALVINYPHCALLVRGLPQDATQLGELRDNLAILMDTVEGRLWSLILQKRADEEAQIKNSFIELLAHSLRTPLNPIVGYSTRLYTRLKNTLEAKDAQALAAITQHAKGLQHTVNDMLNMTQAQNSALSLNLRPVDISQQIALSIAAQAVYAEQNHVVVEQNIAPNLWVQGDAERLSDVIQGLLCNAYHFGHDQRVVITLQEVGAVSIQLSIRDNGPGIEASKKSQIFLNFLERKTTTDTTLPGQGLSLFLCKAITQMHKGAIYVESEPEKGACFSVVLPLAVPAT